MMEDYVPNKRWCALRIWCRPGWPCLVISGRGNFAGNSPEACSWVPARSGDGCPPVIAASRVW
jgi:hypothetical protein